ncbi:MAG: hypothetical protein EYC70_06650 [Planctomycetota bacterium]|nr:MAG: hypothetical protein EYC70_06650 [Planctomycetota bacterium]
MKLRLLSWLGACALLSACGGEPHSDRRVIVLGVDGLDPEMLAERIERGLCPNFQKLVERGALHALQTSWPPQSPVAWSNFITGCNPGKHGLYDFIHVDRKTYGVANSMSYNDPVGLVFHVHPVPYRLPLTGGDAHLTRSFPAFWEVMSDAGVPVAVYRIPANFPPQATGAITYPDMGTPDLLGASAGRATLWTTSPEQSSRDSAFYSIRKVNALPDVEGGGVTRYISQIAGPDNELKDLCRLESELEQALASGDEALARQVRGNMARAKHTSTPFTAHVTRASGKPQLAVQIGDEWGIAELGGWTRWMPVSFELVPLVGSVSGWTRFLFKSAEPFELYGAPVQVDPFAPASPVSTPSSASADLARAIGVYHTQGFPDAYQAYKSRLLSTAEFVDQSDTVMAERGAMLEYALDEFDGRGGLLFFYVGSMDMRCHMLWHCQDPQHPHQEPDGPDHAGQIDRIYQQVDALLGRLMQRAQAWPECELMVMSDHGFAPFRRQMHVNDWLVAEDYLVLKPGVELRDGKVWRDGRLLGESAAIYAMDSHGEPDWDASIVDWSRTRAYCIGFNGIILNRAGREPLGVVTADQAGPLQEEIRSRLRALRDADGTPVFTTVALAQEVFQGPRVGEAPDVQLGFNVGYGASDECATGELTGDGVIVDNDSRWSGSHLMDPELVRGTFITDRKRELRRDPRLEDITATLYARFGVPAPAGMDGQPLF